MMGVFTPWDGIGLGMRQSWRHSLPLDRPRGGLGNCSLHYPHKSHPWLDRTRAASARFLLQPLGNCSMHCPTTHIPVGMPDSLAASAHAP